jgi:glutaredoxin 3
MTDEAITMYANAACPFCVAARNLLRSKNVSWKEVSIDREPAMRAEMMDRSGRRTVPQIFIGDRHVGGFDDLQALDEEGALDPMLAQVRPPQA